MIATFNPFVGLAHMLSQSFMVNAFLAGSAIAVASGLVGYFVVLRNQVFTGDALSHVAFTGALAALAIGIDLRIGLFVGCIAVGLIIGALGRKGHADDVVIGNTFAWVLGLGVFFLTIFTTSRSAGVNATAGVTVLFGSIFGLNGASAATACGIGGAVIVAMIVIGRPLLFATLDEAVAETAGVPVRALGIVFVGLVGATAGEATQAVGALLLLGLLAAPAGAAHRLTHRPFVAMWLAAGLSLLSMWAGLVAAYLWPSLPPSFCILAVATAIFAVAWATTSTHSKARWSEHLHSRVRWRERTADVERVEISIERSGRVE